MGIAIINCENMSGPGVTTPAIMNIIKSAYFLFFDNHLIVITLIFTRNKINNGI
ncbi:MAG: hypothetical protein ABIA17_00040 [Elusimicrobiota bacterium]